MTGLGTGLFLLILLLFQTGSCNYAEILWGQCYAFCLTQHESRLYGEGGVNQGLTIKKCRRDKVCKWCLHACERPRDQYRHNKSCLSHCEKTRPKNYVVAREACNSSCGFIHRSLTVKNGTCPSVVPDVGDGSQSCRNDCQKDVECIDMSKCCMEGCRKKCLRPLEWNLFPPVPERIRFKPRADGSTLLEWRKAVTENSVQPVLYVLRWWCSYRDGVITSITTKLKLRLKGYRQPKGLHPGQPCNFMLAAVNQFGSQGFSTTQQYTKRFLHPSKPGNLEKVRSKLHNDKVNVTIRWLPPIYTDNLPISRYVVLWSDPLPKASPGYERRHMHNKTLDGDKTSYTIPNLEPGTVYFVQVRAVVSWKKRSIRGDPVSTYIETYPIPRIVDLNEVSSEEEEDATSFIYNITVSKPVFIQSQLMAGVTWHVHTGSDIVKYMLYWAPDASCNGEARHRKTQDRLHQEATTHKQEFLLYKLLPNCLFELRIYAVNYFDEIDEGQKKLFQTPPCNETQGSTPELCPPKVSPPLSPVDISYRFKTSTSCVCQVVISWRQAEGEPYYHPPNLPVPASLWNIMWGQSRPPTGSASGTGSGSNLLQAATVVYNTSPHQLNFPRDETRACLAYLEKSKHYTVQVIGQTGETKGKPAVIHFVTPDYMPDCYPDLEGEEDITQDIAVENSTVEADSSLQSGSGGFVACKPNFEILLLIVTFCCVFTTKYL